ncbi:MAG: hypothetical protein H8E64_03325 [Candidatus Marinimicrobia bacterium]|nr:hypothetical protein [Candidatus Neomarinimicrobiota bacterium]
MRNYGLLILLGMSLSSAENIVVKEFAQEVRTFYTIDNGLSDNRVNSVAVTEGGTIYAGTENGLSVFFNNEWKDITTLKGKKIWYVSVKGNTVVAYSAKSETIAKGGMIYLLNQKGEITDTIKLPKKLKVPVKNGDMVFSKRILLSGVGQLYAINPASGGWGKSVNQMDVPAKEIRQIAVAKKNTIMIATDNGIYRHNKHDKKWERIFPDDSERSWAMNDCRSVVIDSKGRMWFAGPQGTGVYDKNWALYEGKDGLPYNDFTKIAAGTKGDMWFGTHKGGIHFEDGVWEYRQGKRWLPNDDVADVAVAPDGSVWFATSEGVSKIHYKAMTLAEKAKFYEDEIDKYHRRTPYEYVLDVTIPKAGDKSEWIQHDSDNDGLWTGMYGAAECFAYAATKDPKAKARAKKAFEALKFLGDVTQDALISPPPGFVARTILPTSGPDPNIGRVEDDIRNQKNNDKLWKVYEHRWPKDKTGKWYYKTDTSSDELDGHYFLYGLYYDLVADTEEEKSRVREHVKKITNHIIDHDFQLVDHDGKPTRWSRFNPYELNHDKNWFVERGLNSLSMLSYLSITHHMTGDERYRELANMLIEEHGYAQNMTDQKFNRGVGTGNHSDDEMAFMNYYHLIKYETNPELKSRYAFSMYMNWMLEASELNPFFNFSFRSVTASEDFVDAWGTYSLDPHEEWLNESVETLIRFPLDRFDWRHTNSNRTDIQKLHPWNRTFDHENNSRKGYRVSGKVFPVDESHVNHWNHDPWHMDTGGNGQNLSTGTVYLLPYYMGLYHGFITE